VFLSRCPVFRHRNKTLTDPSRWPFWVRFTILTGSVTTGLASGLPSPLGLVAGAAAGLLLDRLYGEVFTRLCGYDGLRTAHRNAQRGEHQQGDGTR
jgi:hypothetical protein